MSLFETFFLNQNDFADADRPVITLLYDRLPMDTDFRANVGLLEQFEPLKEPPELSVEQMWTNTHSLLAELRFDGHHVVQIAGIGAPVPPAPQERCIWGSHWRIDLKELMASHKANIILKYAGDHLDPIEQYLALYKVANLFPQMGMLGVMNEPGWSSHPPQVVQNLVSREMLPVVREDPPLLYWCGFFGMKVADITWLVERGHQLFGLPDFAMAIVDEEEVNALDVQHTFHDLFTYFFREQSTPRQGTVVAVDEDHAYEFYDLEDGLNDLQGYHNTIIVHPLSPEEQEVLGAAADQQFSEN